MSTYARTIIQETICDIIKSNTKKNQDTKLHSKPKRFKIKKKIKSHTNTFCSSKDMSLCNNSKKLTTLNKRTHSQFSAKWKKATKVSCTSRSQSNKDNFGMIFTKYFF